MTQYDETAYKLQSSIQTCSTVFMYTFFGVFLLGVFKCKLIVTEMIVEIQLIYYSLITIYNPNPPFQGLMSMEFIGGFYRFPPGLSTETIPTIYSNLGFSSNFFANFNIMIASLGICPTLALILFVCSKFTKTLMMNKKLRRHAKQCIC